MKKVKFKSQMSEVVYKDFKEMLMLNNYIGFQSENGDKYMIITAGDAWGLAINPDGSYAKLGIQEKQSGDYYIFDTGRELLEWMLDY